MKYKLVDNDGASWYDSMVFDSLQQVKSALLDDLASAGELEMSEEEQSRVTAWDLAEMCNFSLERIK